jgi:hypothetical protein
VDPQAYTYCCTLQIRDGTSSCKARTGQDVFDMGKESLPASAARLPADSDAPSVVPAAPWTPAVPYPPTRVLCGCGLYCGAGALRCNVPGLPCSGGSGTGCISPAAVVVDKGGEGEAGGAGTFRILGEVPSCTAVEATPRGLVLAAVPATEAGTAEGVTEGVVTLAVAAAAAAKR